MRRYFNKLLKRKSTVLKQNIFYFKESIKNPEVLDTRYMCLNWDKNIDKYIDATKQLKQLLATIKTLNENNQDATEYYEKLWELSLSKAASKSELNCFVNACDSTTGTIKDSLKNFKIVVDLYLKHRDYTDITPREWIQAIVDKGASRAKGCVGENKLVELAEKAGFVFVKTWEEFLKTPKAIAKFSKNNFDNANIKKNLGVSLKFNSQGKMLDVIVKSNDYYIFIEAKHLKEGGGSQDKQIKELIGIIQQPTGNNKVFYGAFLDGVFSNKLLKLTDENIDNPRTIGKSGKNKTISQQIDIVSSLKNNPNSIWFNTCGFKLFLKDFINN